MSTHLERPAPNEYAEYYGQYIKLVPEGDVLEILALQMETTLAFLAGIGEERAGYRYAPGKWSIKEVVGHVIDIERVFAYRALRFARGDKTPLPGVEQDDLVAGADFDARPLESFTDEFRALRESNIVLFRSFDVESWSRSGTGSGFQMTARSVPYIMAGHELHHMKVVRDRYLEPGEPQQRISS